MSEKRKELRLPEENKVVLNLLPAGNIQGSKESYYCFTMDLSPGGARILTDAPLPVNTNVQVEIALSKSRRLVNGSGKVRWVNSLFENSVFEIGIAFLDMDPASIGAILEHVYKSGAE